MLTTQQFRTTPRHASLTGATTHVPIRDLQSAAIALPERSIASVSECRSGSLPTVALRSTLRALASETGALAGRLGVMRLRPLLKQAHEMLRERFEAGGTSAGTGGASWLPAPISACSSSCPRAATHINH